jgi:hypothetical protein
VAASKARLLNNSRLADLDPLKSDFRNFLYLVWKHLGLPDPTPVQYDLAYHLQHGPKRQINMAFRGIGKSWITSAFVVWLLYCDPQRKIMVVSASKQRADDFTTFTMRLIMEMEILRFLRPREEQRNSKVAFDVGPARPDHSPSVKSVGITGQLTGSRADYIVADDLEVTNNSDTEGKRAKLANDVKEFDAILKPLKTSRIIYLGTPQTEQSIYLELETRGYVIRIWPGRYPKPDRVERYGHRLAPWIIKQLEKNPGLATQPGDPMRGQSVEPTRFSHEDLLERELSYGRSGFALQYMLDTSLSDAERYPLKLSDLIVFPLDSVRGPSDLVWGSAPSQRYERLPAVGLNGDAYYQPIFVAKDFLTYEGSVMFVDPSGRGKDETAYAVVKQLHGRLFFTDYGAFRGGYTEKTLEAICMAARKESVNLILCEPNYGGGMFTQLLKAASQRLYPVTVEDADWVRTQKEARIIDTLEPVLNQHRLVVSPQLIERDFNSVDGYPTEAAPKYRLFFQLSRITRDRGALAHDDRLEALAGAVHYWVESMNRDTMKAHLEAKEAKLDAELEKFKNSVFARRFDYIPDDGQNPNRIRRS